MGRERYSAQQQAFYKAYLNSPAWRARKNARIVKAGGQCEFVIDNFNAPPVRCVRRRYLCVHHNTYERLGAEFDTDLDVYCWAHHLLEHLLWQKCPRCTAPMLENDTIAEQWLNIVLRTMQIELDRGPVNWKILPNKEVLMVQLPPVCGHCEQQMGPRVKQFFNEE